MSTNDTYANPAAETLSLLPEQTDAMVVPQSGSSYRGTSKAAKVVANWHDDKHFGAFWLCTEQPCHAVVRVDR